MKKVMIMAGEASGDLHGSNLAREILRQDPSIALYGVGSVRMRSAGVTMLADAAELSVVGATEVLTHLRPLCRVFGQLKRFLKQERPDLLVLIDFPDFNILLGKAAKKLGIPVLYYISPQVWAWRKGRIRTIANLVRAIIVVFPFEEELYRQAGVDVRFVGHPLTDVVRSELTRADAAERFGLAPDKRTIALLPGSRTKEIAYLLPDMLRAAGLLQERYRDLQFILPVAPTLPRSLFDPYLAQGPVPVTVTEGSVYDVLRASDAALVASGTATLETGLMAVPLVIVYRISALSYAIGRLVVDVDHIGLVNIVAKKGIVPELIQDRATPRAMAEELARLLDDPVYYRRMQQDLVALRGSLGESGASARVAAVVRELLAAAG